MSRPLGGAPFLRDPPPTRLVSPDSQRVDGHPSPKGGSNLRSEGSVEQVDRVTTSIFTCSPPNSTAAQSGSSDRWEHRPLSQLPPLRGQNVPPTLAVSTSHFWVEDMALTPSRGRVTIHPEGKGLSFPARIIPTAPRAAPGGTPFPREPACCETWASVRFLSGAPQEGGTRWLKPAVFSGPVAAKE